MGTRIFAISDLHIDYQENRKLVNSWSGAKYRDDVVIVAGDVTDNMGLLETTLKGLQAKFRQVFFVPGRIHVQKQNICGHPPFVTCDVTSVNVIPCAVYLSS